MKRKLKQRVKQYTARHAYVADTQPAQLVRVYGHDGTLLVNLVAYKPRVLIQNIRIPATRRKK